LASASRLLVGRRPDDQANNNQTAVRDSGGLSSDRHDFSHLKPDHLRLDELQYPQRAVSTILHKNPETATGKPVHGNGHDNHEEQNPTFDHVQYFELHAWKSGDVFKRSHCALDRDHG